MGCTVRTTHIVEKMPHFFGSKAMPAPLDFGILVTLIEFSPQGAECWNQWIPD